ncbi:MAG TPA: biotin--[acetyl-CoA-carboxylase] ligase [bacterium]
MLSVRYEHTTRLVLDSLMQAGRDFVSGEALSQRLGVTRAGLWKRIKNLRELGYIIEGHTAKGYRIFSAPDNPYPWALLDGEDEFWRDAVYYKNTDSTNTVAVGMASRGAVEGTVVVAESQTAGRGRLGRMWVSPPGNNIYISAILRPDMPPYISPQITLVAGVAVARTVEKVTGIRAGIKWPNDLLLNGKKFCGILTEMNSESDKINFIVLGIGVNLNSTIKEYPAEIADNITTLKDVTGRNIPRVEFTMALLGELKKMYKEFLRHGFSNIKKEWSGYFCMSGKDVVISYLDKKVEGTALGIDNSGALLVRKSDDKIERVLSGDVMFLRRRT